MKNKIKLPKGWELKKLEDGLYEVVQKPADLSDIARPYFIDLMGKITRSNPFSRQTKNQMTSIELCEGILALQQLIAFRDKFYEVHGVIYRNNHGSIRFDGNKFMACNTGYENVEVAMFDFAEHEQAKDFLSAHKDLFEELKKLY